MQDALLWSHGLFCAHFSETAVVRVTVDQAEGSVVFTGDP